MVDYMYISGKKYWHYATFTDYRKAQKLIAHIKRQHKTKSYIFKTDAFWSGRRIYKVYFNKVRPAWS